MLIIEINFQDKLKSFFILTEERRLTQVGGILSEAKLPLYKT